ncbi:MAG: acetyl-CoA carboxylase biotin carboxyl carrier protein [Sphingomonadales bacterium]
MSLTAKDVSEIMKLLEDSSFDELTLETGDFKLRLRRGGGAAVVEEQERQPAAAPEPKAKEPAPAVKAGRGAKKKPAIEAPPADGLAEVPSPLLGVFYRAPKPGEPPFVEVGQQVEEETVIGIIEVMKLMNSVRAGVRGEIAEIPAQNGMLVEYGETLIRVRPAA